MSAILVMERSKYQCKLLNIRVQVPFGEIRPQMRVRNTQAVRLLSLHTYLDPFIKKLTLIFGPFHEQVCTHIWSLL